MKTRGTCCHGDSRMKAWRSRTGRSVLCASRRWRSSFTWDSSATFQRGDPHTDDRQYPYPELAEGLEIRLRIAIQGGCLLCERAAVYWQPMEHCESGDDA